MEQKAKEIEQLFIGGLPEYPSPYVLDLLNEIYELGFTLGWKASPAPEAKKTDAKRLRQLAREKRGRDWRPAQQATNLVDSGGNLVLF